MRPQALLRDDRGAMTIATLAVAIVALLIAAALVSVSQAHQAHARAQAVADLAALHGARYAASAGTGATSDDACAQARRVTDRHDVSVSECFQDGSFLQLHVTLDTQVPLPGVREAHAGARAGPAR